MTKVFYLRMLLAAIFFWAVILLPSTGSLHSVAATKVSAIDACQDCLNMCIENYNACRANGGSAYYCASLRYYCSSACLDNECGE